MTELRKPRQIGSVIQILDRYTLLIDAGKRAVSVGDTIQIYTLGEPILDLHGNPLSYYIHIKDELEVIQTEELYSLCKKTKIIEKSVPNVMALSPMLEKTIQEHQPLHINEEEIYPIKSIDTKIHIGDPVKLA
ncbi:MAG: hypothetical protein KH452_06115 [Clostridiales bacterium]|nr:hypothetical protein [Clostridiales bacterium]